MHRVLLSCALALGAAAPAHAATDHYLARSFSERASSGLAVSGPLSQFRAVSRARVVTPTDWTRRSAPSDRLRFITPPSSCRYELTITVRTVVGDPQDPADRAAARLPAQSAAYVLDSGSRQGSAFRVVRRPTGDRVRVDGLWNAVLTRRSDIVPQGQVAWSEIRVTAASRAGDECHSGTYRERLGPQIGDALATARSRLAFVRA